MSLVDLVVGVDWSGRVDAAGQRRHIWAGVWRDGVVSLEAGRTREELVAWLIEEARRTPRMVVGVDFCFSYPAWFLRELGVGSAPAFWELVRATHGEIWLGRACEDLRFWGRPRKKPAEFCGAEGARRMLRPADLECKVAEHLSSEHSVDAVKGIAPKSPFQIGGAGAVGTGTLRGIPLLPLLREAGFAVWPFDAPKLPLLVEIYPRLLTGAVKKSVRAARVAYLRERVAKGAMTPAALKAARGSEDAFDAAISALKMAEHREEFARLTRLDDPLRQLEGKVWFPSGLEE